MREREGVREREGGREREGVRKGGREGGRGKGKMHVAFCLLWKIMVKLPSFVACYNARKKLRYGEK